MLYDRSVERANDWNDTDAVAALENHCNTDCQVNSETGMSTDFGMVVYQYGWGQQAYVEVNALVTTLETTRSSGQYYYVGQYNGHSYFRTSWSENWGTQRNQANNDGAYLLVINNEEERKFLRDITSSNAFLGYYRTVKSGTDFAIPGVWKWVEERDPNTGFDIRLPESAVTATLTATLDRKYSKDVSITLTTSGSATITDDYTLSTEAITISAGSVTGTSTLTIVEDNTDEDDRDTVQIEVSASTYAVETVDQKILIAIEDNDQMPGVTLTASKDSISENGGTSDLTATLSAVSGRDVTVGLVMQGSLNP